MKKAITSLIGAAVLALTMVGNNSAWAGTKSTPEVTIFALYGGGYQASGSRVGARYSSDTTQFIGCSMYTNGTTRCDARDKNGKTFFCITSDPKWFNVLQAVTDSSYFVLKVDSGGHCTTIELNNNSYTLK